MTVGAQAPLGQTSVSVTRLGFGSAPLGNLFETVAEEAASAAIEEAWSLGLRFFDTAPLYGYGVAEQRLGRFLADGPRDEFVLATKVGRLMRPNALVDDGLHRHGDPLFKDTPPVSPVFDFSYDGVMRSVEESLERLGLDHVDVLHIHDPDEHFEEALSGAYVALDELRSQGTIGAVGAGMTQVDMLARFAREADFDCFLLAGRYTLLDHTEVQRLLSLCEERGIALIVGGVYNSGILAAPAPGATFDYRPAPPDLLDRAFRIDRVCDRHGVPLKAAAIQFPFGSPAVASVLTGSRSAAELRENVQMFNHPIPGALWDDLRAEGLLSPELPVPGSSDAT